MQHATILVSSVTAALRAQRLLVARGIPVTIKKITNHPQMGGCGYGLDIYADVQAVLTLLAAGDVHIVGVVR